MNHNQFVISRFYNGCGINSYEYDTDNQIIYKAEESYEDRSISGIDHEVLHYIRGIYKKSNLPVIFTEKYMIYYFGFEDKARHLFVFGPIASEYLTKNQLKAYCHEHKIKVKSYQVPCIPIVRGMSYLTLVCYMITGEKYLEKDLLAQNDSVTDLQESDLYTYQFEQQEQEKGHQTSDCERKLLESIERGEFNENMYPDLSIVEKVGTLAINDDLKQKEYIAVAVITLAARAAINGGASPDKMYNMSDLYLQRLSKCTNSIDIMTLLTRAVKSFSNEVRLLNSQLRCGEYVEQCKEYIAKKLYKKISISIMAKELGLNRSYLSRKFSEETGMTLSGYITEERLKTSANMLKYSEETINNIANYMCFSSHSRYSELFKEKYGMTPTEYRRKNRTVEFILSNKSHNI